MPDIQVYTLSSPCNYEKGAGPTQHLVPAGPFADPLFLTGQQAIEGAIHTVTTTNPRNWTWIGRAFTLTGATGIIALFRVDVCSEPTGEGGTYRADLTTFMEFDMRKAGGVWCWDAPLNDFEYNRGDLIVPVIGVLGEQAIEYTTSLRLKQF